MANDGTYLWDINNINAPGNVIENTNLDFYGSNLASVFLSNPFSIGDFTVNETGMNSVVFPDPDSSKYSGQRDTSSLKLGERGIINPLWQYNSNADPRTAGCTGVNYGRVYNRQIRANNPIVFIQPGRPKFTNASFLESLFGKAGKASELRKSLANQSLFEGVTGGAAGCVFSMENLLAELQSLSSEQEEGTMKFYDFEPDFNTYRHYVAALTDELQVRMGLDKMYKSRAGTSLYSYDERSTANNSNSSLGSSSRLDMFTQFTRFYGFMENAAAQSKKIGSAEVQSGFIPFRVEKSTDASDSFDNQIGSSMYEQAIKDVPGIEMAKEAMYLGQVGNSKGGGSIGGLTSAGIELVTAAKNAIVKGTSENLVGAAEIVKQGGNLLFPAIWKESGYSKSLSINIKLHAPYGDPICYFESILFPLACLLTLALPEQIQGPSYASPPLMRIRSRGWFSCDMGMVESISIKRGSDKNDWTLGRLPRSVEVTLSIRDLFGTMVMSLMSGVGSAKYFAKQNTALRDYLNTIGGLDTFSESKIGARLSKAWRNLQINSGRAFNGLTWQQGLQSIASKFTPVTKLYTNFFN